MKIKEFLANHRENFQLIYGIFLIVLIPILIAFNTFFIISTYNDNIDAILRMKTLTIGRTIYTALQEDLNDYDTVQQRIEKLSQRNDELENIEVLIPATEPANTSQQNSTDINADTSSSETSDGYKIIASSDKTEIGKFLTFYFYQSVWSQPDNDGLSTDSLQLAATEDGSSLALNPKNNGRFWIVAMPMKDSSGNKKAILSMRISSKVVDDLTNSSRNSSLLILIITILIIILFLAITVQLWDYVVLYRKIKELDQMKDEFISIASHELRSPLTSIKGYTSLIMEGTFGKIENKDMNQSLDRIMVSTKRLEALVEDLLDVSRIEQGRLAMQMDNVKIEPIIDEIVSQFMINAKEKNLELIYKKPEKELPLVCADADRLKQVLVNLISNSIKYTEKGSVTVTAEIQADNKFKLKVTDTGIGISPEAQKSLFQKFYRVKTEKTQDIQGTGLGLWIVKQIVEMMNGKIYLESIEGQGTQVSVVLNTTGKKI